MNLFRLNKVLALGGAALLSVAMSGVASAQTLPTITGNEQLQQTVLAGKADAVSQFLGISTTQLQTELAGNTLAQVARQHGKSASDITNVVVNSADQQLDAAVSPGEVSPVDTAAQYKSQIGFFAPFLVNSPDADTRDGAAGRRVLTARRYDLCVRPKALRKPASPWSAPALAG